jgi:hypothetical protein
MFTNYQDDPGEVNRTLAHEAVHIAQVCRFNDLDKSHTLTYTKRLITHNNEVSLSS